MANPSIAAPFHVVVLHSGLLIVRAPGGNWRAIQTQYEDFKTSLGPYPLEPLLDVLFDEWPSLAWREADIRLWACGDDAVFDLEAPLRS